jgi:electron transport complex protein RnfG
MSDEKRPPRDEEVYTPQGGGGGTGSGPLGPLGEPDSESRSVTLHQIEPEAGEAPPVPPAPGGGKDASALRLLGTLAFAGVIAGAVLVFVYLWSHPIILANQAKVLAESIQEVLKAPDHYETVFVYEGELTAALPAGVDSIPLDKVYLGFDGNGAPVGFAVQGAEAGFQDVINLIFGYDPIDKQVLGMKVMEAKETPGLGDKIMKDSAFIGEFNGVEAPIVGVKTGRATGAPDEVDMITGATISSRAVIGIINHRVEALDPLLTRYMEQVESGQTSGAGAGKEDRS